MSDTQEYNNINFDVLLVSEYSPLLDVFSFFTRKEKIQMMGVCKIFQKVGLLHIGKSSFSKNDIFKVNSKINIFKKDLKYTAIRYQEKICKRFLDFQTHFPSEFLEVKIEIFSKNAKFDEINLFYKRKFPKNEENMQKEFDEMIKDPFFLMQSLKLSKELCYQYKETKQPKIFKKKFCLIEKNSKNIIKMRLDLEEDISFEDLKINFNLKDSFEILRKQFENLDRLVLFGDTSCVEIVNCLPCFNFWRDFFNFFECYSFFSFDDYKEKFFIELLLEKLSNLMPNENFLKFEEEISNFFKVLKFIFEIFPFTKKELAKLLFSSKFGELIDKIFFSIEKNSDFESSKRKFSFFSDFQMIEVLVRNTKLNIQGNWTGRIEIKPSESVMFLSKLFFKVMKQEVGEENEMEEERKDRECNTRILQRITILIKNYPTIMERVKRNPDNNFIILSAKKNIINSSLYQSLEKLGFDPTKCDRNGKRFVYYFMLNFNSNVHNFELFLSLIEKHQIPLDSSTIPLSALSNNFGDSKKLIEKLMKENIKLEFSDYEWITSDPFVSYIIINDQESVKNVFSIIKNYHSFDLKPSEFFSMKSTEKGISAISKAMQFFDFQIFSSFFENCKDFDNFENLDKNILINLSSAFFSFPQNLLKNNKSSPSKEECENEKIKALIMIKDRLGEKKFKVFVDFTNEYLQNCLDLSFLNENFKIAQKLIEFGAQSKVINNPKSKISKTLSEKQILILEKIIKQDNDKIFDFFFKENSFFIFGDELLKEFVGNLFSEGSLQIFDFLRSKNLLKERFFSENFEFLIKKTFDSPLRDSFDDKIQRKLQLLKILIEKSQKENIFDEKILKLTKDNNHFEIFNFFFMSSPKLVEINFENENFFKNFEEFVTFFFFDFKKEKRNLKENDLKNLKIILSTQKNSKFLGNKLKILNNNLLIDFSTKYYNYPLFKTILPFYIENNFFLKTNIEHEKIEILNLEEIFQLKDLKDLSTRNNFLKDIINPISEMNFFETLMEEITKVGKLHILGYLMTKSIKKELKKILVQNNKNSKFFK